MKLFKQLALAATLGIIGVGAHAATEVEYFVIDPASNTLGNVPGTNEQLYDFSNSTTLTTGDPRVAHDAFTDNFVFNVQDAEDVSFAGVSMFSSSPRTLGKQEVSFTSVSLYAFNDVTDTYALAQSAVGGVFFGGELSLTSGVYVLAINGIINIGDGAYSGQLQFNPTSPVPEPGSLALMLAGLAGLGATARRRSRR